MINKLPIIGWLLSAIAAVSLAVPFWICWTVSGLGSTYFYWLPPVYLSIPFWHFAGLFIIASILKGMVPKLAHITQSNRNDHKAK